MPVPRSLVQSLTQAGLQVLVALASHSGPAGPPLLKALQGLLILSGAASYTCLSSLSAQLTSALAPLVSGLFQPWRHQASPCHGAWAQAVPSPGHPPPQAFSGESCQATEFHPGKACGFLRLCSTFSWCHTCLPYNISYGFTVRGFEGAGGSKDWVLCLSLTRLISFGF